MDAEGVWWLEVSQICRELVAAAQGVPIAGVCVSGVGPCLVLCDEADQPLRPAILYGIDMRATEEIEELTAHLGADTIMAMGGTALTSQAVGPKMAWVRRHESAIWERARRWYNSSSFIAARLTGEYVLDHHTASQCDPLYDLPGRRWVEPWCDELAPGLPFPRLAWPMDVVGTVTAAAADRTGLTPGTPVCAGTVDAWAEAFSVGATTPGDLMLMYGSTMFFVQTVDQVRTHPLLWATCGVQPGSYSIAAGMSTSGTLADWVRELTGGQDWETLTVEASAVPPGSNGLLVLPYFAGERTPHYDPRARGVVAGLSLQHGRGHLLRAAYEGIAFGIRQNLDLLAEVDGPAQRILAVGGGTASRLWTQIVSDVTGREQLLPEQTIGASFGDAQLAAIGAGVIDPTSPWNATGSMVRPHEGRRDLYDAMFELYEDLYPASRATVHSLAHLQGHSP